MYMYMYTYIHVYVYVYIYLNIYKNIYANIHINTCIYIYIPWHLAYDRFAQIDAPQYLGQSLSVNLYMQIFILISVHIV
jgi:hypothetical protein